MPAPGDSPAPPAPRSLLGRWWPAALWMALIFLASADADSGARGSRLIGPFLDWIVPALTPEARAAVILGMRKVVHVVTFGVLALLVHRALRRNSQAPWSWGQALAALGLTLLYAISDEVHQSFVPTRVGSPADVLLDTLGAVIALVGSRRIGDWRVTR